MFSYMAAYPSSSPALSRLSTPTVSGIEAQDKQDTTVSGCGLTMNNVYSRNRHCWLLIA